jgi:CheY-like chemotaxis protein
MVTVFCSLSSSSGSRMMSVAGSPSVPSSQNRTAFIEKFRSHRPDVTLTDLQMPDFMLL